MAEFNFNVADVPAESNDFGPLPAGRYNLVVLEAELVLTKKAKEANDPSLGQYVKVKLQVLDGPKQNRLLWSNFNVINANPKAAEIGTQQFSNMLSSMGITSIEDTSQLNGKTVAAEVKVSPDTGYGEGNDVKRFYKIGDRPVATTDSPKPESGGAVHF